MALASAVLWTVGRQALDDRRFADETVAALSSTAGRAAISARLADQVRGRVPASVPPADVDRAIAAAVDRAAASPRFAPVLAGVVLHAHDLIISGSGEPVEIDLGQLRALLVSELDGVDPTIASRLPPAAALDGVTIATGIEVPVIPGARLNGRVPVVCGLLALIALALIVLAMAISERHGRTALRIAPALLLCALVPLAVGMVGPELAASAVSDRDADLARGLAEGLLGGWTAAALALVAAGVALLAVGLAMGRAHPPNRRRAA